MTEYARWVAPANRWLEWDLAMLDLPDRFDLVQAAGNVIPLLAPGTEAQTVRRVTAHLAEGGVLVTGWGPNVAHLPLESLPFGLAEYDGLCGEAGLELVARFATWDREPYTAGGYAVNVHRRSGDQSARAAPLAEGLGY